MSEIIYFASDFHLGAPTGSESLIREKRIIAWLELIKKDASELYLMGDLFDFWFEYKHVIPKGFTRFLGKLAELSDMGIKISIFSGNHDLWMKDYLGVEINAQVIHVPQIKTFGNKTFYLAHGDGLGPGDKGYKFLKSVFTNTFAQWLFRVLHPDWGIGLANYFSKKSRMHTGKSDEEFFGEDREWLIIHSREVLQTRHIDYFVYGHRHLPYQLSLGGNSEYVNLGDWISHYTYARFDGENLRLLKYE